MHIPARLTGPGARRVGRVLAVTSIALLGGLVGLLLGARAETPVGPTDVSLNLRPTFEGGTTVEIPPLGALHLDTHEGPFQLRAQITNLRPEAAKDLVENTGDLNGLTDQIVDELRDGLVVMLVRALTLTVLFGFAAGLVVFRSWRRALFGTAAPVAALTGVAVLGWATFNPGAVAEPRYTGLLANAPQVVGDTRDIVSRFTEYRAQLAKLVGNVSRLYAATSSLPTYEPDPSTIRVLHVSDIHLNPAAWNVVRSVSTQFQADLIIDSGDIMDHGSKPEDRFVDDIKTLKIPYVYVRGNHDSRGSERAVARQKNAIVLDDATRDVEGLTIYGLGDPRYTPDKSTRDDNLRGEELRAGTVPIADKLRAAGTKPDIIVTHDPAQALAFSGLSPLLLAGHTHSRKTELLPSGSRLSTQGSTGGAGLRGLEQEKPTPISLSVLYFSRSDHRLQGWDDITLGGLGLTSAQIERHLEPTPGRPVTPPTPSPAPTPPSPTTTRPAAD
ncbi:metallophosphoesterase family protein [Actinomadura flavalba]|uniref:metallophosphoesterase family protein n=1 Tax=Actinomadura flavalba TaxID=1120938 RepID=UPI000369F5F6|nr:metallophosphoesterase [Actinomadura flavalba]